MSMINISKVEIEKKRLAVRNDIDIMRKDVPISAEAKIRSYMLFSIFYEYAKYLHATDHNHKTTKELVFTEVEAFKKDNRDYCPINFSQQLQDKIQLLYSPNNDIKKNIKNNFLNLSADVFLKYIPDPNIQIGLDSATESMKDTSFNFETKMLADVYFDECISRIHKSCSPSLEFKAALN